MSMTGSHVEEEPTKVEMAIALVVLFGIAWFGC